MPDTDDEVCVQAFQAYKDAGENKTVAAERLGIPRTTLRRRIELYRLRNLGGEYPVSVLPGHEIVSKTDRYGADGAHLGTSIKTGRGAGDEFEVPGGHEVAGVSALTDRDGNVYQKWVKTRATAASRVNAIEGIRLAVEALLAEAGAAAPPRGQAPEAPEDDAVLTLLPLPDLHLGLFAAAGKTGEAWDLPTALAVYRRHLTKLIRETPGADVFVLLGGGDLLHADDETRRTRRSGHGLDVSHSYEECLSEACLLLVEAIEHARSRNLRVLVRILPGNHDPDSAVAVTWFLAAWYRGAEDVEVDTSADDFWIYQWGRQALIANHGHEVKPHELIPILAARARAVWGATVHRDAHSFHVHHKTAGEDKAGGGRWETHLSPSAKDSHHHQAGYGSGRAFVTIRYSQHTGECGRLIERVAGLR